MPTGQLFFINLMKKLGYEHATMEGMCFGIAMMSMQSFLAGDMDTFDKRIRLIDSFTDDDINRWKKERKLDIEIGQSDSKMRLHDLYAFFDGVQLYQYPMSYDHMFSGLITQQNIPAKRLLTPVNLDNEDKKPVSWPTFTGAYDLSELTEYIEALQETLTTPTALLLSSSNHSVNLNYDPENKQWLVVDANSLPSAKCSHNNSKALAQHIIEGFPGRNADRTIFATKIFINQSHKTELDVTMHKLARSPSWKRIHTATFIKSRFFDVTNASWLYVAAKVGDTETVKALLKEAKNPLSLNEATELAIATAYKAYDQTKLSSTYMTVREETLKKLMTPGLDIDSKGLSGLTPLWVATQNGHVEIVKTLLEGGADFNIKASSGNTLIGQAAWMGQTEILKVLLEKGADPNIKNADGRTSLWIAVKQGHAEAVKVLLEHGADPHITYDGDRPLWVAADNGHTECVKILSEKDPHINLEGSFGTPLYIAASRRHIETVKVLLKNGADPNITKYGKTPLFRVIENDYKDAEIVKVLLENGANVDLGDPDSKPIHLAVVREGKAEILKMLLENGANIELEDPDKKTPLYIAAERGNIECVNVLLEKGADINKQRMDGSTALFIAAQNGHIEVVRALLEKGADMNVKVRERRSAFDLFMLLSSGKGSNTNLEQPSGITPLYIAVQKGHAEVVQALLNKGANADLQGPNGLTPRALAERAGDQEIVKLFDAKTLSSNVSDGYINN